MKTKIALFTLKSLIVTVLLAATGCAHYNAMQGFPDPGVDINGQIKALTRTVNSISTNLDSITTLEMRNKYIDQRANLIDLEYVKYLLSPA